MTTNSRGFVTREIPKTNGAACGTSPPIAGIKPRCDNLEMTEVIYLPPGEQIPEAAGDEPWLMVEASDDGRFFGSGWGRKPSGESVFYASLPENDVTLEAAIAAATVWAVERSVPRIWVHTTPA